MRNYRLDERIAGPVHTMKLQSRPIIKDLIVPHSLTDDEYEKIVEILERELSCVGMDS